MFMALAILSPKQTGLDIKLKSANLLFPAVFQDFSETEFLNLTDHLSLVGVGVMHDRKPAEMEGALADHTSTHEQFDRDVWSLWTMGQFQRAA